MSTRYSIARRTPALNGLFAGLACAIALTLTAGPALAQPGDLERVEIRGHVVEAPMHYDVHAACQDIDAQLQSRLDSTWAHEGRYGEVDVQVVMHDGAIGDVEAKGISNSIARAVRKAVSRVDCSQQAGAGAQLYRFTVAFINPNAPASAQMAAAKPGTVRIALISK